MLNIWVVIGFITVPISAYSPIKKDQIADETQISNPRSFDYNFDDDLRKPADTNDIYDEIVPYLPQFNAFKNGKNIGVSRVPIVTRKVPTWSTPPPRAAAIDNYADWSPSTAKPRLSFLRYTGTTARPRFSNFLREKTTQRPRFSPILRITTTTPRTTTTTTTRRTTTTTRTTRATTPRPRPTQAPVFQKKIERKPLKPSRTEIPINVEPNEERVQNLHFSKFAQRFGVNRVVPTTQSTTTRRTTTQRSTARPRITTTRRPISSVSQNHRVNSVKTVERSIVSLPIPKPLLIHYGDKPYFGPTYNCKVLNPNRDGQPTERTDKSCQLSAPGISADGSCRCTFEVDGRDANGCAKGFLYTCVRR